MLEKSHQESMYDGRFYKFRARRRMNALCKPAYLTLRTDTPV